MTSTEKKHRQVVIWRENGTLICICYKKECLLHKELECAIYGKDDTSIADTAAFFLVVTAYRTQESWSTN